MLKRRDEWKKEKSFFLEIKEQNGSNFISQTNLIEYELCCEVDVVQFVCLLHISPLLFYKALYGILQLLPVRKQQNSVQKP